MKTFWDIFRGKNFIFIAEIGLNHNGSVQTAREMMIKAAKAGADAVKFQTFVPQLMNSVYTSSLIEHGTEKKSSKKEVKFFKKLTLSKEEYTELFDLAKKLDLIIFSSPFDAESVNLLESLGVELYKIASSEVTNHLLLKEIAKTGKPAVMSTGISTEDEINMAVNILNPCDIKLLHCVSLYPLPPEHANMKRILSLKDKFNLETGFSDHTKDSKTIEIAAALGARIFEKHFTLNKKFDCPDRDVSITPSELKKIRKSIEKIILMTGEGRIDYNSPERETARLARRSLFAAKFIPKGKTITAEDIAAKRPGIGIPVYRMDDLIGKKAAKDINEDYLLKTEYLV